MDAKKKRLKKKKTPRRLKVVSRSPTQKSENVGVIRGYTKGITHTHTVTE